MAVWIVLFRKEWLEALRSMKLVWMPLVFALLGAGQPISAYFMPQIMEHAGNLPEDAVISIPLPSPSEALAQVMQQFGTLGVLIVVLAFMGTVSSEIASGTASFTLVKPVSRLAVVTAKWATALSIVWLSYAIGFGAGWYYDEMLIGSPAVGSALAGFGAYGLWLSFVVTLTVLFSVLLRSAAGTAFAALALTVVLSIASSLLPNVWQPGALPGVAASIVQGLHVEQSAAIIAETLCGIVLLIAAASLILRRRALP
ncbi:ABC transporter permease [Paenibacillus sp. MMS18-CY102]|uniref:ABC transporter permease n=1 Tax=Paenibacillus sp. MMS18-CY102 TaxID=2682849 RepID=UPI00136644BD|nr:ABC transporter permease subunit [Paenibacillus sp. MMS18-CY102]MWC30687.1 ABC transporter permease subunit [Paenibacillus sp. MMS18-CY102]